MNRVLRFAVSCLVLTGAGACSGGTDSQPVVPTGPPTYYEDVAPILNRTCAACHAPGAIAPMPLLSYEQAKQVAPAIKRATHDRTMPPFAVDDSGACHTYADARWLTDDEI